MKMNKNLAAMKRIDKPNAGMVILTHRPNKKDVFWGEFLDNLKNHPKHNNAAEFIVARNRCGGKRDGMLSNDFKN